MKYVALIALVLFVLFGFSAVVDFFAAILQIGPVLWIVVCVLLFAAAVFMTVMRLMEKKIIAALGYGFAAFAIMKFFLNFVI